MPVHRSIRERIRTLSLTVCGAGMALLVLFVGPLLVLQNMRFQSAGLRQLFNTNAEYLGFLISVNDIVGINRQMKIFTRHPSLETLEVRTNNMHFTARNPENSVRYFSGDLLTYRDTFEFRTRGGDESVRISWKARLDPTSILLLLGVGSAAILVLTLAIAFVGRRWTNTVLSPFAEIETTIDGLNFERLAMDTTPTNWVEVQNLKAKFNDMVNRLQEREQFKTRAEVGRQVAHDIRSPLSLVRILAAKSDSMSISEKEMLCSVADRLEAIVADLDRPSRSVETLELNALVHEVLEAKRVEFGTRFPQVRLNSSASAALNVRLEPTAFGRCLSNLVNNAAEAYCGEAGEIHVTTKRMDRENCVLRVEDRAGGIPAAVISKIREGGFVTSKKNHSGLGLKYAFHVAQKDQLQMQILVEEGRSTAVEFTIPVAAGELA